MGALDQSVSPHTRVFHEASERECRAVCLSKSDEVVLWNCKPTSDLLSIFLDMLRRRKPRHDK